MTPPEAIMDDPTRSDPWFFDRFNISTAIIGGNPESLKAIERSVMSKSPWTDIPPAAGDWYREQKEREAVRELVGAYRHFGMEAEARELLAEYGLENLPPEQSSDTESAGK